MGFVVTAALVGVMTALIWWLFGGFRRNTGDIYKMPGPRPVLPILGNALQLKRGGCALFAQLVDFWRMYKSPVYSLWLGPNPVVILCQAEALEKIVNSSKHMSKSKEYNFLHEWLGTGLLTSTGSKWKSRRRLLTPTFHYKILTDFVDVYNEQAETMIQKLDAKVDKGEFNIFNNVTLCALDIICETAMGRDVGAQKNSESPYVQSVYRMTDLVQIRMISPWQWNDFLYSFMPNGKEYRKCISTLQGFTKQVIRDRKAELEEQMSKDTESNRAVALDSLEQASTIGKSKRLAFLDMLLYSAFSNPDMTETDILEEVDTFMFEGHDTTAAAMNWAIHLLGAHQDVQKKLQEEMDQIFGDTDRHVTMDDIKQMKYMDRVIKEALRLFPSVPMFGRETSEDCVLDKYKVPKGTTVLTFTPAVHRDARYFPDPEKFDPDRFLPENINGRHPFTYIPFSAGLRNCIGQKFAQNEEKVLLSHIVRRYNIESTQKRDELKPNGSLILRPDKGIYVKLTHRKKAPSNGNI